MENQDQLQNRLTKFDEFAVVHKVAHKTFTDAYTERIPSPVKPEFSRDRVGIIIVLAMCITMGASMLISGSRSYEEFGGGAFGFIATLMLEFGIIATGFFIARRDTSDTKSRINHARKWAIGGLILAFITAVAANIVVVLAAHGIVISQTVVTIINLIVAVSAPTEAFITSHAVSLEIMSQEAQRRMFEEEYQKKLKKWHSDLDKAWRQQAGRWGVRIERPVSEVPSALPAPRPAEAGETKAPRSAPKTAWVIAYLKANPGDLETPSRQLSEQFKAQGMVVSHVTIKDIQNTLKQEQSQEISVQ